MSAEAYIVREGRELRGEELRLYHKLHLSGSYHCLNCGHEMQELKYPCPYCGYNLYRSRYIMNATEQYFHDRDERIKKSEDYQIPHGIGAFMDVIHSTEYVRNFSWLGRPILQLPTDLMALQEIVWQVKPDFIIETGVAFGGLTVFFASLLESINPLFPDGRVIGIDIEIRNHNKQELLLHPLWQRIVLIEGSSISQVTGKRVRGMIKKGSKVLVALDSDHTHDHVLKELQMYAPLVSMGSYVVVFDTSIEWLDPRYIPAGKLWGKGNNPWTAIQEFMKSSDEFIADRDIENRILLTSCPGGWLKRIKEGK